MATVAEVAPVPPPWRRARRRWRRGMAYTLLTAWALLMFVPFAWTIITSLKDRPEAMESGFPRRPTSTLTRTSGAGWIRRSRSCS